MAKPLVSVISSVYNVEEYIRETVENILAQDYSNLELIIVDDASSDSTREILQQLASEDDRVTILHNDDNMGPSAKNIAIKKAKGDYIAVMDGDDVYYPHRLSAQVEYLENHRDIIACSSHAVTFGSARRLIWTHTSPEEIASFVYINMPMVHPTFTFRSEVVHKHDLWYDKRERFIQDYELVYRISKVGQLANVDEILVDYRRHPKQVTANTEGFLKKAYDNIAPLKRRQLEDLGMELSQEELDIYLNFCYWVPMKEKESWNRLNQLLSQVLRYSNAKAEGKKVFAAHYLHLMKKSGKVTDPSSWARYFKLFGISAVVYYITFNLMKRKMLKNAPKRV